VTRSQVALFVVIAALAVLLFLARSNDEPQHAEPPPVYPPPLGYLCNRANSSIKIDGDLNDPAWSDAAWSEDFQDIEGHIRPTPAHRTRVKMLWDDRALYIAADLDEPHVWGTLRDHDAIIFNDNDFEVFLDPDADGHLYGELELNALNTTWDLLLVKPYKDSGAALHAWEITGLQTAVRVHGTLNYPLDRDTGWTVEIAWPWEGLKELAIGPFPPRHGEQWRINFSRVEWDHQIVDGKYRKVPDRPEHNWVWSPQGVIDMHRPDRWGILQFSNAVPGSVNRRPDPAQAARDYLHRVYYAQLAQRKKNGRYLDSLIALGDKGRLTSKELSNPSLESTANGFEASVMLNLRDGKHERWRITNDARIKRD
jgi:hypothetical protein